MSRVRTQESLTHFRLACQAALAKALTRRTAEGLRPLGDEARRTLVGSGALAVCRRILTVTDTAMSCDEIAVVMAEIAADARQVVSAADAERVAL